MKILKYILVIVFLSLTIAGCQEKTKTNSWQNVSFEELMPKGAPLNTKDTIVGLSFFILEADRAMYLDLQTAVLSQSDLQVDASANKASAENGMICGSGNMQKWSQITKTLADANAAVLKRLTLFMTADVSEQIEIADFTQPTAVSYYTNDKKFAAVGLPKGTICFDINAKALLGLKQACLLEIKPVYRTSKKKNTGKYTPPQQYTFDSAVCKAQIRPGQFVFLTSQDNTSNEAEQNTLLNIGQLICSNQYTEKRVKFFLIVCGLIKD